MSKIQKLLAAAIAAAALAAPMVAAAQDLDEGIIIVGAIHDEAETKAAPASDSATPELPVVHEDNKSTGEAKAASGSDLGHIVEAQ